MDSKPFSGEMERRRADTEVWFGHAGVATPRESTSRDGGRQVFDTRPSRKALATTKGPVLICAFFYAIRAQVVELADTLS